MATMTVSGVVSGMDWEGMIATMIEKAQKPAQVQMNKRVNLTNKKTLFEEMKELTQALQGSLTSLRLSSTYRAKEVEVERLDATGSAKSVLTAKVNADARAGVYNVDVKQLATAQTLRSNQFTDTLNALGNNVGGSTLWINNAGQRVGVDVKASDTLSDLAARINNTIKTLNDPMNLTASVVDGRLIFKSDTTGLAETTVTETIRYSNGSNNALKNLKVDLNTLQEGDIVIKSDNMSWKNGTSFDIVETPNGQEVRWRAADADSTPPGYAYTAQYTAKPGDVYTSDSITRNEGNMDFGVLKFTPSSSLDASHISITDEEGFTYEYGVDFTVQGQSIVWNKGGGAGRPEEGLAYKVTYTAGGDSFESGEHTRGSGNNRVLSLTSSTSGTTLSYSDLDLTNGTIYVETTSGKTYKYGEDFTINNSGGSPQIAWLGAAGIVGPENGTKFHVYYVEPAASGAETFDLPMTRGATDTLSLDYNSVKDKKLIITSDSGDCYQGLDFEITEDSATGKAVVNWKTDSAWVMPQPGTYAVNVYDQDWTLTGTSTETRTATDTVNIAENFSTANGEISDVKYKDTSLIPGYLSISGDKNATITWTDRPSEPRADLPSSGTELTVSYTYSDNVFSLDDGGSGLLSALGLDRTDEEHYTAAQDAIVDVDGTEWVISDNYTEYENDMLNGVKLEFKGVGKVSLDVTLNTEKAVESINTFVESYNTLMDWINVRSSEKQVNTNYSDDSTSLSRSSDEFHTSWGLLYGNSYLRSTKTSLRNIVAGQNFSLTFSERTSSQPVYGDMAFNGLKRKVIRTFSGSADSADVQRVMATSNGAKRTINGNNIEEDVSTTLRISLGTSRYANITITSSDTLESIAAKINNDGTDSETNEAWSLHYDDADRYDENGKELTGEALEKALTQKKKSYVRAEVVNHKLVIKTGSSAAAGEEISLSGTDALNALNMNTTYKGLYQVGLGTTSNDYGKSGELEFNSSTFTNALEDNPEEVEKLMMAFAKQMDAHMKTMLTSSGEMSGTLTRQISTLETQITDIDEYLSKFQKRLDDKEEALRKQYAAAEERIAKLSQQASSISSILTQISSGGNANSSSS